MLVIILTHAMAEDVKRPQFRGLSEGGLVEADAAAARFEEIVSIMLPELNLRKIHIGKILSSPMARCVETVLRFANKIRGFTATSEIRIVDRLREKRHGQLSAGDIISVLDDTSSEAVLLCTHGDLQGALPKNAAFKQHAGKDGWFTPRPVIVIMKYDCKVSWDDTKIFCCEAMTGNNWETLLESEART